jgi:hypothetical protein
MEILATASKFPTVCDVELSGSKKNPEFAGDQVGSRNWESQLPVAV